VADTATVNELPPHIADGLRHLPTHMHGGIARYIVRGIPPGSFLTAVLSNDLMGAFGKADDENRDALFEWARFIYNFAPTGCHGSPEKVSAWISSGGLLGKEAA
jgi:hypothetical protein